MRLVFSGQAGDREILRAVPVSSLLFRPASFRICPPRRPVALVSPIDFSEARLSAVRHKAFADQTAAFARRRGLGRRIFQSRRPACCYRLCCDPRSGLCADSEDLLRGVAQSSPSPNL
jgi:hypothetical protein